MTNIIDPPQANHREKMLHWVRAGHDAAFMYDIQSDSFEALGGRGLPLGVTANTAYEQLQCEIRPGQIIAHFVLTNIATKDYIQIS